MSAKIQEANETQHTPTPWSWERESGSGLIQILHHRAEYPGQGSVVICVDDLTEADAKFIVRAVNSRDDLLASCKALLEYLIDDNPGGFLGGDDWMTKLADEAKAAIKKAESN